MPNPYPCAPSGAEPNSSSSASEGEFSSRAEPGDEARGTGTALGDVCPTPAHDRQKRATSAVCQCVIEPALNAATQPAETSVLMRRRTEVRPSAPGRLRRRHTTTALRGAPIGRGPPPQQQAAVLAEVRTRRDGSQRRGFREARQIPMRRDVPAPDGALR